MPRTSRYPTRSSSNRSYSVVQSERRSERSRNDRFMTVQQASISRNSNSTSNHHGYNLHQSQYSQPQLSMQYNNNGSSSNIHLTHTLQMPAINPMQYYSMPVINPMPFSKRPEVTFCKLNSYDEMRVLIKPKSISKY